MKNPILEAINQIDDVNFMEDEKEGFVFYLNKIFIKATFIFLTTTLL